METERAIASIQWMLRHCQEQQEIQGKADAFTTFSVRGSWGKRTRARLLGKHGGPYGTILANDFNQPGMIVVGFKADEVITFLTTLLRKLDGAA